MLDVWFTIDVEVWCDGWKDIERKFPESFQRQVHGPGGDHGLPFQLKVLSDHGLQSVCFVEPLFSGRFGRAPLAEIVGLVQEAGHEVQLHLHTEWVDESREPLLPNTGPKRQHLHHFDLNEQTQLLGVGIDWLQQAGAPRPTAFRAGSFAFNHLTLDALASNGIPIDSSYNASTFGPSSGVCPGELLHAARQIGPVLELPMTVYHDGRGLRHAQLKACSAVEMEHLLWQALESGHDNFVVLSHNFELLARDKETVDPVVTRRLRRLCRFLDRHRDCFRVRGMRTGGLAPAPAAPAPLLTSPLWCTGLRMVEQAWRRTYD